MANPWKIGSNKIIDAPMTTAPVVNKIGVVLTAPASMMACLIGIPSFNLISIKSISNTAERFEKLAELEPNNRELYLSCSYSFKALLKFRTKQGLLHHDSGQFIALESLSKMEKIKLKRTFKTIKELQELISVRFNISNIV